MTWKPSVLVVAPTPSVASTVFAWLIDAGYAPRVVSSFAAAKQLLEEQPCLVVSEVRLGEFNGLHLALRAQAAGIPTVLLGEPEPVLQRDAAQLGALYLSHRLDAEQFFRAIEPLTHAVVPKRGWRDEPARHVTTGSVSFISVEERRRAATRHSIPFSS